MLSLGFRPFYLLAALFALLAVPLWITSWQGGIQPGSYLSGMAWHGHEMVFGFSAALERTALLGAMDLIAILIAVMGGRVIPAFTENAFPALRLQRVPAVETAALGTLVLVLAAGLMRPWWTLPGVTWVTLLVLAAAVHGIRLMLWQPLKTRRNALLWMLPAAYAWQIGRAHV